MPNKLTLDKQDINVQQHHQALLFGMKERALLLEMQQRATIAEEEVTALRQQHLILKSYCENEKEKNANTQTKLQQLHLALQEKEVLLSELKQQLLAVQQKPQPNHTTQNNEAISRALQPVVEENSLLTKSLVDSQQHGKQLERVIQFLRERGEEANLEVKQLREEFQNTQGKQLEQGHELTHLQEENLQLKTSLEELLIVREEKERLDNLLQTAQGLLEEKEHSFKIAQQHLAKKMKEVALLSERNGEQRTQLLEIQQAYLDAQAKISFLQRNLDTQTSKEQQLQELLEDNQRAIELQNQRWEEKYFNLHTQWQKLEQHNSSLKALEERHRQAQLVISNLLPLLENPINFTEEKKEAPPEEPKKEARKEEQQDLFTLPTQQTRYKKTLFD